MNISQHKYCKKNSVIYTVCFLCMLFPFPLLAESLVVIINPQSHLSNLTRSQVINIYMGRQKKLTDKYFALPLDLNNSNKFKKKFYKVLLNKELPEINSYWARLIFSGQGSPPRQMDSYDDIRHTVLNNLGAIGYLPESELTNKLKRVYTLKD